MEKGTTMIGLRVDLAFARELRVEAARQDRSRSALMREALSDKLAEIRRQRSAEQVQRAEGGSDE